MREAHARDRAEHARVVDELTADLDAHRVAKAELLADLEGHRRTLSGLMGRSRPIDSRRA